MRQNVSQGTLVVLGSTGATGRLVVQAALDRGHEIRAVVRRPGALKQCSGLTEVVWPDLDDVDGLAAALDGADAVISALGGAARGPTTVCTDAMRSVVPAMGRAGVRRLVVVSAHGVGESRGRSLYARAVWSAVADRMRDKESMEQVITGSDLDWTIVRPPALKDAEPRARYRTGEHLTIRLWSAIGRADLADFLIREVESPSFLHGRPRISW